MAELQNKGLPILGIIFLALAVLKLVQGENWVVWAILGVLFGGLGIFRRKSQGPDGQ